MSNSRFKFRVWDKENKEMMYQPLADLEDLYIGVIDGILYTDTFEAGMVRADDDRFELTQSTGLYDCEGREVWEGDIVEILVTNNLLGDKKFISLVQYSNELHGCPNCHSCSEFLASGLFIPDLDAEAIEWREGSYFKVIGNRFENPELL